MAGALVAFLQERQAELIERWMAALRGAGAGAPLSRYQLEDRLLAYLRRLTDTLGHPDATAPQALAETRRLAAEHGEQRLELGYDIAAVVRDYAALPEALEGLLGESRFRPSAEEVLRLTRFLVEGIATAAHAYSLEHDARTREAAAQHTGFLVHDLRQPLQSLKLRADLMERRGAPLADDIRVIRRDLQNLSEQVDSALAQSRLEALPAPVIESVQVKPMLDYLAGEATPLAQAKGIELSVEAQPNLVVDADVRLLRSALGNLIYNAIKFSKEAGTVRVRARSAPPEHVVFEVEDTCGGLPPGATEKLFDPFVQLGGDRTGFGLGLALARRVVDLHSGALRVHDLPGTGCVFVLELPVRPLEKLQ